MKNDQSQTHFTGIYHFISKLSKRTLFEKRYLLFCFLQYIRKSAVKSKSVSRKDCAFPLKAFKAVLTFLIYITVLLLLFFSSKVSSSSIPLLNVIFTSNNLTVNQSQIPNGSCQCIKIAFYDFQNNSTHISENILSKQQSVVFCYEQQINQSLKYIKERSLLRAFWQQNYFFANFHYFFSFLHCLSEISKNLSVKVTGVLIFAQNL